MRSGSHSRREARPAETRREIGGAHPVLALQRSAGNRATGRVLQRWGLPVAEMASEELAARREVETIAAGDIRGLWPTRKGDFLAVASDFQNTLGSAQLYQIWLRYWMDRQAEAYPEFKRLDAAVKKADPNAFIDNKPRFDAGVRGVFPADYEDAADRLAAANYYSSELVGVRDWLESYVDGMHNRVTLEQINAKAVEIIKAKELRGHILGFALALASAPLREPLPSRIASDDLVPLARPKLPGRPVRVANDNATPFGPQPATAARPAEQQLPATGTDGPIRLPSRARTRTRAQAEDGNRPPSTPPPPGPQPPEVGSDEPPPTLRSPAPQPPEVASDEPPPTLRSPTLHPEPIGSAPRDQRPSGPGVDYGLELARRLIAQGQVGRAALRAAVADLNAQSAMSPEAKAMALKTVCDSQPPEAKFGAGPVVQMPNGDYVITPGTETRAAPVLIVRPDGTIVKGTAHLTRSADGKSVIVKDVTATSGSVGPFDRPELPDGPNTTANDNVVPSARPELPGRPQQAANDNPVPWGRPKAPALLQLEGVGSVPRSERPSGLGVTYGKRLAARLRAQEPEDDRAATRAAVKYLNGQTSMDPLHKAQALATVYNSRPGLGAHTVVEMSGGDCVVTAIRAGESESVRVVRTNGVIVWGWARLELVDGGTTLRVSNVRVAPTDPLTDR